MKVRQNPIVSNKENHPILPKDISRKSIPISTNDNRKVLGQQNQKTIAQGKLEKIDHKQNLLSRKNKCDDLEERKTIQNKIKDMLKDKQQLFNYLESEKEFISTLENQDIHLKNLDKQRGKLASSLTEKKKLRTQTSGAYKRKVDSTFKRIDQCLVQYHKTSNAKIINNSSVTIEVVNTNEKISQQQRSEPCEIQSKHYETISFDNMNIENNEKSKQKIIKSSVTEGSQPPKYCLVLTQQNKKKQKRVSVKNYAHQHFNFTKYGLTNFSPWGFSKDTKHNDFDMIEMGSFENSFDNGDKGRLKKQKFGQNENGNTFKIEEVNQQEILKKDQFLSKSIQFKKKIRTESQSKLAIQKNHFILSYNDNYDKKEPQKEQNSLPKPKKEEKLHEIALKERSQKQVNAHKLYELNKIKANQLVKKEDPVNILKSSQVIILNSNPGKVAQIFAPKSLIKHQMNKKHSLNKDFRLTKNQAKIFHTEISEDISGDLRKMRTIGNQLEDQQNELIEMNKTEQFLKQIIINKNNIIYPNQNNLQILTKNNLRSISKPHQKHEANSKIISTNKSAEVGFKTYNHLKSECIFLETQTNFVNEKRKFIGSDKQNIGSDGQEMHYNKGKEPLDKNLHQNEVYQLISSSNTKFLAEGNLSGFYMITDSKLRNDRNAFVRRKRHSTMVTKNRKFSHSAYNKEEEKRRFSYSVQKKDVHNRSDLSLLQQNKGYGIINPITKKLYKKYVSIVQQRRL